MAKLLWSIAIAVGLSSCSVQATALAGQLSADELAAELAEIARAVFSEAGARPTAEADSQLREMLRQGARRVVEEERDDGPTVARSSTREFATAMVTAARRSGERNEDGTLRLAEQAYQAARGLCPLYPFC